MRSSRTACRLVLGLLIALRNPARADTPSTQVKPPRKDLTDLSLLELAEVEVTSVSKRPEKVSNAAAAVFVISGDDIRRSGARTLPEALRLAPGLQVARINANQWAVGIRGFASRLSRSLLVLVDGRSVYSPLFGGTYWEVQDTVLEDIDRIEVIRGPGGAIWGSNAVAGVINIITKSARQTPGTYAKAGGGTEERLFGSARYGFSLGEAAARVYGKYVERGPQLHLAGEAPYDAWHLTEGGFRTDVAAGAKTALTLTGDVYSGHLGQRVTYGLYTPPYAVTDFRQAHVSGGNLLARGTHELADGGTLEAQAYWDRTTRSEANFSEARSTFDVEVRHLARLPLQQELVWGLGYRVSTGRGQGVETVVFDPESKRDSIFNVFFQDQLPLVRSRLVLVAGAKLEHNDYSGWEVQPNLRLLFTPRATQTVWAAVSRAVRTPTRVDEDLSLTVLASPNGPTFLRLQGSRDFVAEAVLAYELGWRGQLSPRFWVDVAAFYDRHSHLLSLEPGPPFTERGFTIAPLVESNRVAAKAWGAEVSAEAAIGSAWRLRAAYSFLRLDVHPLPGSRDVFAAGTEGASPRHQVSLLSSWNLPAGVELDAWLRYVGALPSQSVPSYTTADLRIGWKPHRVVELALVGQNLFQPSHAEFGAPAARVTIRRGVFGEVALRW